MRYRLFWSAVSLVCLSGYAKASFIEICKADNPTGSLSGLSSFAIAGQAGTVVVPVGACSPAIQLPDGFATINEFSQPGSILIGVATFPTNRLISFDPITERVVVLTVPGDISTETVITFTNSSIPEPATGWLFALGLTFCALRSHRLKREVVALARNRIWPMGFPFSAEIASVTALGRANLSVVQGVQDDQQSKE